MKNTWYGARIATEIPEPGASPGHTETPEGLAGEIPNEGAISQDLTALYDRLGPEAIEIRTLIRTEDGKPGPLGRMVLVYRLLRARGGVSATDMAEDVWDALPESDRTSIAPEKDLFVARMKRWFQPSQAPYASLTANQADALEAAAETVAHQSLGQGGQIVDVRSLGRQRHASRRLRAAPQRPNNLGEPISTRYIDKEFLLNRSFLGPTHERVAKLLYSDYLVEERHKPELFCVAGESYSGKKSVLSHVIQNYVNEPHHLPVFALQCAGLTYTEVGVRLAAFLGEVRLATAFRGTSFGPGDWTDDGNDWLKLVRHDAPSFPAVYILADLEILPGNAAYQLITQQDDIAQLINILLCGHQRTRVIISCGEPRPDLRDAVNQRSGTSPFFMTTWEPGGGWPGPDCTLIILAPPTVRALLDSRTGRANEQIVAQLQKFRDDPVDGVALRLGESLLRIHNEKGTLDEGVRQIELLLETNRSAAAKLSPDSLADQIWKLLTPTQKLICVTIAASDDGMRETTIAWVIGRLPSSPTDEQRDAALESLNRIFGYSLKREYLDQDTQPWALDDLPGERIEDSLFAFDRLTRLAILARVEAGSNPERELMRQIHRLVAAKAREQAHHRRLNVSGVYGARIRDLLRDIQALLSLMASVSREEISSSNTPLKLLPLEVERAVIEGRADGRTVLRFAYLQLWRQDIDRDYRLSTEHAAEELRLHVLLALATSIGKTFVPTLPYKITKDDLDALRPVLSDDELLEFLTSLAMSAHQTGSFALAEEASEYAEQYLTEKPGKQAVLRMKLQRAHIDTLILGCRDITLPAIEKRVRCYIKSASGDDPAAKQARLKLYLRLGEVCHLQGENPVGAKRTKRDDAQDAFKRAANLEAELANGESCVEGRALISGYGARRYLRATLDWARMEAQKGNLKATEDFLSKARDLHAISLRRLSRHAADRASILLDEARLHRVEGYVQQHLHGNTSAAREDFGKAHKLVAAAHDFVIQPGLPIAVRLDLDALVTRIGLQLAEVDEGNKDELLSACESSARRLKRVADRFEFKAYQAYSRLLAFATRTAQDEYQSNLPRASKDSRLVDDLREAFHICKNIGLGLYQGEIERQLVECGE